MHTLDAQTLYATIYLYQKYPLIASQEPFSSNPKYLNIIILIIVCMLAYSGVPRLLEEGILEMKHFQLSEESIAVPAGGKDFLQSVHLMVKERAERPSRHAHCSVCSTALKGLDMSSLLAWLLHNGHHEVAKLWAKESKLHPPDGLTQFEDWINPKTAIREGQCDLMSFWLSSGLQLGRSRLTLDLLILAIHHRQTPMLSWMLANDASLDECDVEGLTPLHHAVQLGDEVIIRMLLDRGPKWIVKTSSSKLQGYKTALHYAAESANEAIVKLLLDRGADITEQCESKRTALHYAAKRHDQRGVIITKLLLDGGAEIDSRCQNKKTALHYAAEHGDKMTIRLLLNRGAEVESICELGFTASYYAAMRGLKDEVKLLRGMSLYRAMLGNFPGDEPPLAFSTAVKQVEAGTKDI